MITTDHQGEQLLVTVLGEFTLADFQEFEQLEMDSARAGDRLTLLFDLRQMAGVTLDVAWEEIKFSRQHAHDFGRIAVLSDSQWVAWSAWLSQNFVDADLRVFVDAEEARNWLQESE